MKAIDLSTKAASLPELLRLAGRQDIVVRTSSGREFLITEIDEFDEEVARTRRNRRLTRFLNERSKAGRTYSLDQVKSRLGIQ